MVGVGVTCWSMTEAVMVQLKIWFAVVTGTKAEAEVRAASGVWAGLAVGLEPHVGRSAE